jgi:hypothetical protein
MADIQVANTDADLSGNTVLTAEESYTITGQHTFSRGANAPFACITGSAVVTYLNADKVDGVEAAALLRVDGSLALSANWDAGGYEIRSNTFESDVATGTSPLVVASTTKVANLNADLLDDQTGTYYLAAANITGTTLASNVVTSSLTTVGTIATGVWNGTSIGTGYTDAKVTSVVAGTAVDVSGATGDVTVNVDLSELSTSTTDGDGDYFVVVDTADAQKKLTKANISIGGFNTAVATSITATGTIASGVWNGTAVAAAYGGTGQTSYTTGDLPYASGSTAISKLGIGTANKVLTSSGSAPQWSTQVVNAALPTNIDVGGTLDVTGVTTLDSIAVFSSGCTFNASETGAANTLDDYEEGTFTPVLAGASSGVAAGYDEQVGLYTVVGNRVFINIAIDLNDKGTLVGFLKVQGLPFTNGAGSAMLATSMSQVVQGADYRGIAPVYGSSAFMYLFKQKQSAAASNAQMDTDDINDSTIMMFTGSYTV